MARHPRISTLLRGRISGIGEEILASLLGAMISMAEEDRNNLVAKATAELLNHEEDVQIASRRLQDLSHLLEALL